MHVRVKLLGTLGPKSPPGGVLEMPAEATVAAVLAALGIGAQQMQVVMVNSRPERDHTRTLQEGDEVTVLAPIGGG